MWRNKQIPYYDKMLILYGQDRVTREYAKTASEMRQNASLNRADLETIVNIDQLVANNQATLEGLMDTIMKMNVRNLLDFILKVPLKAQLCL